MLTWMEQGPTLPDNNVARDDELVYRLLFGRLRRGEGIQ